MSFNRIGIKYVQRSQLKESKGNPRIISDEQYRALAENVRRYGIVDPLIVDQRYRIVGGHQRLKVLRDLGIKKVPVVKLTLSRRDFKILNLALNKISGEWDQARLVPLLEELAPLPELDLTGFSQQEANLILEDFSAQQEPNEDIVPDLPKKTSTRTGDLYHLGKHRLICGNSTDAKVWQRLLDGKKAGMMFTDPPYGVNYDLSRKFAQHPSGMKKHHKSWGKIEGDEDFSASLSTLPHAFANLTADGVAYITCGSKLLVALANWMHENNVRYSPFLIWDKSHPVITWERYHAEHEFIIHCGPGSYPSRGKGNVKSRWFGPKNETTVWRIPRDLNSQRTHPAQKPVALYERALINSSTRADIIVDPFAGSGTCIIAAEKHGRTAYCIEIDPRYVDVAVKRWEQFTGKRAIRERKSCG